MITRMELDHQDRFPVAARYHPDWVRASASGGANALWLAEWLAEAIELRPGMRVLDLACGRAMSSVFLHREFGAQVWAVDLWHSASENLQRIRDAGVEDGVFPLHADARSLPFAAEFFDAVVSIDAFVYFGTDDLYLTDLARLVKPGGPGDRRGRTEPRDRRPGTRAPTRLVGARPLVPALGRVVAAPLGADGHPRRRSRRRDARRVATVARLATRGRAGQRSGDRGCRGRCRPVPRLRARAVARRTDLRLDEPIVSIPSRYERHPLLRER